MKLDDYVEKCKRERSGAITEAINASAARDAAIQERDEAIKERDKVCELLSQLLDNSSVFYSAIELSGLNGFTWEAKARSCLDKWRSRA